jgi:hypothetical protein
MIYTLHKIDPIKDDKINGACRTNGGDEKLIEGDGRKT